MHVIGWQQPCTQTRVGEVAEARLRASRRSGCAVFRAAVPVEPHWIVLDGAAAAVAYCISVSAARKGSRQLMKISNGNTY